MASTLSTRTSTAGYDWPGLVWTLIRTDFKVRYHGTLMGFFWALLKPLVMFLTLMAVFSLLFGSQPAYRSNLILGLFLWEFFAEGTKVGLTSLAVKGFLVAKSRVPRWIVVVTSCFNPLFTVTVVSTAIVVVLAASGRPVSATGVFLFVVYLVHYVAIVIGFSLAASVLFLRYRDLNQVWEVVTHAGFFLAPIIYPLDIIPERFHVWFYLWPPTPVIQFSRMVLVLGEVPSLQAHLMLAAMASSILATGVLVYRRHAPRIAEFL